jgi:hypothetical protein
MMMMQFRGKPDKMINVSFDLQFRESIITLSGYAVAQLVEALRYKPEGRGFDSRWSHWNFSVTILPVAL